MARRASASRQSRGCPQLLRPHGNGQAAAVREPGVLHRAGQVPRHRRQQVIRTKYVYIDQQCMHATLVQNFIPLVVPYVAGLTGNMFPLHASPNLTADLSGLADYALVRWIPIP